MYLQMINNYLEMGFRHHARELSRLANRFHPRQKQLFNNAMKGKHLPAAAKKQPAKKTVAGGTQGKAANKKGAQDGAEANQAKATTKKTTSKTDSDSAKKS